jgi:hypothetical protein
MEKLAIVFGFFHRPASAGGTKTTAYNSIIQRNNVPLITRLTEYRTGLNSQLINSAYNFPPLTHVGLTYNGVFYDFYSNRVHANESNSFIPVMHFNIYNRIKNKIQSA